MFDFRIWSRLRQIRIEYEGAIYHCMARGNRGGGEVLKKYKDEIAILFE